MPDQRDPLEQLNQFGAGFSNGASGGPMPHSAAEARQRGNQIRRRRTAVVAGGAALAVAAVAVPIFAVVGGDAGPSDKDRVADNPTPRSSALSADDVLADGETAYYTWGDWLAEGDRAPSAGDGQAVTFSCQRSALSDLGASESFSQFWDFGPGGERVTEPYPPTLAEEIAQFPDAATARAAYETVTEWVTDCNAIAEADEVDHLQTRPVDIDGGEGVIIDLHGRPVPVEADPYGDSAYINETGLVLLDDRIAVVSLTGIGQDYTWLDEQGGTPMHRMLPVAAERLAPGPNVPVLPAAIDQVETTGDTAIADDFPLAEGWPDSSTVEPGEDGLAGPNRTLDPITFSACDTDLGTAPHEDQLVATWSNVEDYRTRQLTTYLTVAEAEEALAEIRDLYRGCPEGEDRDDGFTPNWSVDPVADVGDDAYAVLGWDELDGSATTFGDSTLVVRVGNAILVSTRGGHAGNPQGREDAIVAEMVAEAATALDAMCSFEARGC